MLLVCLDDGRLSGGVPLSQKYHIGGSSLTQAANFHMAKVLWRSIRYSMQLEYPLIVRPSSTRFQAIRSIGLAAVRTGTNDLCPAVPCDGVKARRTVLYHGV